MGVKKAKGDFESSMEKKLSDLAERNKRLGEGMDEAQRRLKEAVRGMPHTTLSSSADR